MVRLGFFVSLILTALVASLMWGQSTRERYNIKSTHLGANDLAIVCLNGADPTGIKHGDVLIISCGRK